MKNFQISRREKILLISLSVLVASYGFDQGISRPFALKQGELRKRSVISQKKWLENLRMIRQAQDMKKRFQNVLGDVHDSSPQDVLSQMLQNIESSGRQEEVVMVNLNPAPIKEFDVYHQLMVSLEVEGEFVNVMRFVHELQKQPSSLFVKEWQLEPSISSGMKDKNSLRSCLTLVKMVRKPW